VTEGLKLRAKDSEDLGVVSSVLQDAVVNPADMEWLVGEERFAVVLSRYCWERDTGADAAAAGRVHSGLCFGAVRGVRIRGMDRRDRGAVYELLAICPDEGHVDLLFAGGACIRLEVGEILCHLQDLDEPWPTIWRPRHEDPAQEDAAAPRAGEPGQAPGRR